MKVGKLRHKIDIAYRTASTGSRGGPTSTDWEDLYTNVPAHIEQLSGTELEQARQLVPESTHKFVIRYHGGVSLGDRILFSGAFYYIDSINNVEERNFWQEIVATKSNEIVPIETVPI
ncbi:phage head closure protein [Aeoliella sp.]|uniref:phage head closure protein n=1 Tax=Aeoliella sp. TaxID=2795800 RepID=UPI003CCB80A9